MSSRSLTFPKAILFDWDNTLVDTSLGIYKTLEATLAHFNRPSIDQEHFLAYHAPLMGAEYMKTFFTSEEGEAALLYFREYAQIHHLSFLNVMVGALELITQCNEQNIPLGIVSNRRTLLLNQEIDALGWRKHFKAIVGLGDTPHEKPHTAPLKYALNTLNINAGHDIWFIGDSPYDYECAVSGGCFPILIGETGVFSPMIDYDRVLCVTNLPAIKKMLLECKKRLGVFSNSL